MKILISACLLGEAVRYDGGHCLRHLSPEANAVIQQWQTQGMLLALCPEVAGGLPVPRPAAELVGARVHTVAGDDVTDAFMAGAKQALALCQKHDIQYAVLKQGSPSCGSKVIRDGSFSGQKIAGQGFTAQMLTSAGIQVFDEHEVLKLYAALGT